jgi:aspartate aminotransferase
VEPGDEVLVPSPVWVSYPAMVRAAGGTVRLLPREAATRFKVGVDDLERAWSPRVKLLVIVSPGNPTGVAYSRAELERLGAWAQRRGAWVLCDEVYRQLTFEHNASASLAASDSLADRCAVVDGTSKAYAMTGWRVGWLTGPPSLIRAATQLQSHSTSGVSHVCQAAAFAALTGPQDATEAIRTDLKRRAAIVSKRLAGIPGLGCVPPDGAFYAFASVHGVLGREVLEGRPRTSAELADSLLTRAGLAVVAGEAFHAPGHLRLSFCCSESELIAGLDRLELALQCPDAS